MLMRPPCCLWGIMPIRYELIKEKRLVCAQRPEGENHAGKL